MHRMQPPSPAVPADVLKAQGYARAMRVHRRQCILLCTCVEKAFSARSPVDEEPESGQQWDEYNASIVGFLAISNIIERLAEWSKLGVVQSFIQADQILMGIDQLCGELQWCGMQIEAARLAEKRKQDEEILQDTLRNIALQEDLLTEVLSQPSDSVNLFIGKLQTTLLGSADHTILHAKLEHALMFIYKMTTARLLTPDLTSQISDVESVPTPASPLFKTYHADWLEEERVIIRSCRLVRYTPTYVKRFRREVAAYYAASKHPNIVRTYGMVLDEGLGCCIVAPMLPSTINALSFLNRIGDTNVVPWLLDIASAMHHLHTWVPTVVCGCIRADNVWIRDDGASVCISDFGLFQLSTHMADATSKMLPWCAPEIIRAIKEENGGSSVSSVCTKQTDVYSFGMIMFGDETLEPEILHGTRPTMSPEIKARASRRGFSASMNSLMKTCWDQEPMKRTGMDVIINKITWHANQEALTKSGELESIRYRPESSAGSIMSRASLSTASSGRDSSLHPMTPRSMGSLRGSSFTSSSSRNEKPTIAGHGLFSSSQLFSEPASIELTNRRMYRQESVELSRKISKMSLQSRPSVSENTIRQEPRSSFSSDSSEKESSHLGQRENSAYERMPKLKSANLSATKALSKNRFEILTSPMTSDGRVNPNWIGVSSMEGLRGMSRRPGKLTQVSAVESLIKRESLFLSDTTDEYLAHRLRANPGLLGVARLETFLTSVLEDSRTLRLVNQHFRNALQANPNVMENGFAQFSFLCKEAAIQFSLVYPAYIQHLEDVQKIIADELDANDRFSEVMSEKQSDGMTLHQRLRHFLCAPVTHLNQHPRTLQLIISEMDVNDPDRPLLLEALTEMFKTVNLVRISEWQRSNSDKSVGWKDFVTKETIKGASKLDINRQTATFDFISAEKTYVGALKMLQKVLQSIFWELDSLRRAEDALLQEIMKTILAVIQDILRFHSRLLENIFTLQRSQHPMIGTFVTPCGIDQIPWHSLYDHRFGNAYRKLVGLVQDGKARMGKFKRVVQREQCLADVEFMQFLCTPSIHLRSFLSSLKKIAELSNNQNEDRQIIMEMFPRLSDICQQVELKTSTSRERARLTSLAASLDFSNFPSVENDVDIASSSRILIMSGNLKLGFAASQMKRLFLEERFTLLLDNYLLFTRKSENQGVLRLEIYEKPLALELLMISSEDIPPTSVDEALFPCVKIQASNGDPVYLYAETEHTSRIWRSKLEESQSLRAELVEKTRVIDLEVLHKFARIPSSSAEFRHNGEDVLAVAYASGHPTPGIWLRHGRDLNLRLSVSTDSVSQLTILEEQGIVLSLAGKSLFWYRQEELMKGARVNQRLVDESMSVDFFRTGALASQFFLVVSARRKGKNVLRFFEISGNVKTSKVMNAFKNKSGPFSLLAETEHKGQIRDVHFLKSSFVILGDAFQLVNYIDARRLKESLSSTKIQLLPLSSDPLTDLADRCRSSEPVAIHRVDKDFILCYRGFAAYINANGQLSPKIIEWESSNVQNIVFRPPYMLILGTTTVEIRQIANGKLVQLLAVPGGVTLSWERRYDEDHNALGIHLIIGSGRGYPHDHWFSLDNSLPYTLFRLSRH